MQKKGKTVVRLKGGDPFVFGRGAEEAEALARHGICFEVVPGITSGIAVPAYANIPITHRDFGRSFAVVTGHCKKRFTRRDKLVPIGEFCGYDRYLYGNESSFLYHHELNRGW